MLHHIVVGMLLNVYTDLEITLSGTNVPECLENICTSTVGKESFIKTSKYILRSESIRHFQHIKIKINTKTRLFIDHQGNQNSSETGYFLKVAIYKTGIPFPPLYC